MYSCLQRIQVYTSPTPVQWVQYENSIYNNILNCPHGEIPCEVNVHRRDFLRGVNKF